MSYHEATQLLFVVATGLERLQRDAKKWGRASADEVNTVSWQGDRLEQSDGQLNLGISSSRMAQNPASPPGDFLRRSSTKPLFPRPRGRMRSSCEAGPPR